MQRKFTLLCLLVALLAAGVARAQVLQDNFTDGNFTANPVWGGNTADFIVNPSFELQLSAVVNTSTPRYLSVAANTSLADSTTWEFYSYQDFSPSTTNFGRVYLTADNSDLTASLNGYYVKLGGTAGTTDALELYRQTGTTSTLICASAPSTMGGLTTTVRVRVTRNTSGVWELWADYSNGTNYVLQGTGTDNTHASGSFFGVNCVFTTTRSAHFYFDDIYVSPLFVDVIAPTLVSANATTATNVDALFSEPITGATANNIANYTLDNGAAVSAAQIDGSNPRLVHLTTLAPLVSGTTYLLTTNNISDLSGNILNNGQQSFTYFDVQPAVVGDIIISEIMADPDPRVGLPNLEYVELYNRSNKYINLQSYVFNEGSARTLAAHIMPPNSYVVLTALANVDSFISTGTVLGLSGMGLTNGGEFLSLSDNLGNVIDSLTYSDTWYRDAVKKNGGWSLELINPNLVCKGASNWIASNNALGGTPNAQNSVFNNTPDTQAPSFTSVIFTANTSVRLTFDDALDRTAAQNAANYTFTGGVSATNAVFVYPNQVIVTVSPAFTNQTAYTVTVGSGLTDCVGNAIGANNNRSFTYYDILPAQFQDLIFNELMIDPDPVVGLPNAEYVELYNRANYAINLQGMSFIHVSTSSGAATVTTLTDYTILPNDYVILHGSSSTAEFALLTNKRLVVTSFPSLNNTSASLMLRNSSNQRIDSLAYTDDWYRDSNKKSGGWALELINPTHLCKESDNWRASSSTAGGTPAAVNSIFSLAPDLSPPTILGSRFVGNTQILIYTDKILDAATTADVNNYTISGGLVITSAYVSNQRDIVLVLSTPMQHQTTYNVVIDGVEDCLDNILSGTTAVTYYDTEQAAHYDIIINEIFPDTDPQIGLPLKEYVELYNRSNKFINLQDFTFQDRSSSIAELPFYIMPPNTYLVVASDDDTVGFAQFGNYVLVANFPDLNVSSDDAILRDFLGNVIDAVAYEQSWYQNSTKAAGGWSLERINYNRPCEGATNWIASDNMLGGTPAQPNSVLQTTPDNTAPQLIRAFPPAANQIRLYFTEAVSDIDAINISNYTMSPNTAPLVVSAVVEPPFYSTVLLSLDADLQAGITYTLTLNTAYRDCIGTAIAANALSAQVALPVAPEANDLIINEILFNPVTGGSDFVELYNRSTKVINARSLIFANTNADGNINQTQNVLTDYLIFPNQYLVVTPDPDHVKSRYNPQNPFWIVKNSLPTYDDSESTVWIYTTSGSVATTIDKFAYNKTLHQAMLADQNGVSLERISPEIATADSNNWHSGASVVNYATPTYQNSSFRAGASPTDNLIDIPNLTFSPDGDGFEDFLLINYDLDALGYVARVYIYDAHGRLVRRLTDGELFAQKGYLQWDGSDEKGFKATTGIYVVDVELTNPALGTIRRYKKSCVVASRL